MREQRYRVSSHANQEMSADGLEAVDVENVVLMGRIDRELTHDPRGTRYVIAGPATDGRNAYVVCRSLPIDFLLIITAYVDES